MKTYFMILYVGVLLYMGMFLATRDIKHVLERIATSLEDISSEMRRCGP